MTQECDREGLLFILQQELRQKGWEADQCNPTCNYRQLSALVAARPKLVLLDISLQGGALAVASMLKGSCPESQLLLLYVQAADDALTERLQESYGAAAVIVIPPHLLEKEEALRKHLRKQVPPGPALIGAGSCV